jgi:hypothetical protein
MGGLWYRNENGKQRIGAGKYWIVALWVGGVDTVFLHQAKIHCGTLNPLKRGHPTISFQRPRTSIYKAEHQV